MAKPAIDYVIYDILLFSRRLVFKPATVAEGELGNVLWSKFILAGAGRAKIPFDIFARKSHELCITIRIRRDKISHYIPVIRSAFKVSVVSAGHLYLVLYVADRILVQAVEEVSFGYLKQFLAQYTCIGGDKVGLRGLDGIGESIKRPGSAPESLGFPDDIQNFDRTDRRSFFDWFLGKPLLKDGLLHLSHRLHVLQEGLSSFSVFSRIEEVDDGRIVETCQSRPLDVALIDVLVDVLLHLFKMPFKHSEHDGGLPVVGDDWTEGFGLEAVVALIDNRRRYEVGDSLEETVEF